MEKNNQTKREGGLGFRDLEKFNQALLGKQVWRILQNPGCLMSRVLKARYFPNGDILSATPKKKASYVWKSILYGRDLVRQEMKYIIGDGTHVNIWSDPWLKDHPPRPPRSRHAQPGVIKVHELFSDNGRIWNEEKIREVVVAEDVEKNLSIKLCSSAENDLLGWHYNGEGIYLVKSGYWLSSHPPLAEQLPPIHGSNILKQRIWKTKVSPKIRHFLWRLNSRCLATKSNLHRRRIINDTECPRCYQGEETEHHIFFECPYAKQIWIASGVANDVINSSHSSFTEKI